MIGNLPCREWLSKRERERERKRGGECGICPHGERKGRYQNFTTFRKHSLHYVGNKCIALWSCFNGINI